MPLRPLDEGRGTEPRPVRASLDGVARRMGAPDAAAVVDVSRRWREIVGETVAAHAEPGALRDGVLVVAVEEPGWATQLRFLSADVLRCCAEVLGPDVVREIDVRVRRPASGRRR